MDILFSFFVRTVCQDKFFKPSTILQTDKVLELDNYRPHLHLQSSPGHPLAQNSTFLTRERGKFPPVWDIAVRRPTVWKRSSYVSHTVPGKHSLIEGLPLIRQSQTWPGRESSATPKVFHFRHDQYKIRLQSANHVTAKGEQDGTEGLEMTANGWAL